MKTVAKHDNQWKLQKQETHQVVERNCERVLALLMGCWLSLENLNLPSWLETVVARLPGLDLDAGLRPWRLLRSRRIRLTRASKEDLFNYRRQRSKIYALNLSISLSAGKESNSDSPSNGEWTGKSPTLNQRGWMPSLSCRSSLHGRAAARLEVSWNGVLHRGWQPRTRCEPSVTTVMVGKSRSVWECWANRQVSLC